MLRWIGGIAFVLVVIFAGCDDEQDRQRVRAAEAKKREVQRVLKKIDHNTQQKEKNIQRLNNLRKAYGEAKTEEERARLLQELIEAKAEVLKEIRSRR